MENNIMCCDNEADFESEIDYPEYSEPIEEVPLKIGVVTEEDPVTGKGQFDKYMRAGNNQLDIQYTRGRIKGAEYAASFVAMQESMMGQSNSFIIEEFKTRVLAYKTAFEISEAKAKGKLERQLLAVQIAKEEMGIRLIMTQMEEVKQNISLSCMQEAEASANGVNQRAVGQADIDLKYTQRAEAVSNGVSQRTEAELNGISQRTEAELNGISTRDLQTADENLKNTQESELVLNGTSKRNVEEQEVLVKQEMIELYKAQTTSFESKDRNDVFKSIINGWSVFAAEVGDFDASNVQNFNATEMENTINAASVAVSLPPVTP